MPITLGCPSCGKKFRARDESAGKKVKCPYCQSAVQVSAPDGAGAASESDVAPPAPAVASPADWGTAAPAASSLPLSPPPAPSPIPEPRREPEPARQSAPHRDEVPKPRPRPAANWNGKADETPEKVLAAGWKRARRGLFWVQFALCWFMLIGFVEFGKSIYERQVGPLPKGDGAGWVTIDGFINSGGQDAIPVQKEEMINLAAYGIPGVLGLLLAAFGRLVASGAPRRSGACGLFSASSLFTLLALIALAAAAVFSTSFKELSLQGQKAFILLVPLTEFLFLVGLVCCGMALNHPGTARTVGFLAVLLTGMIATREFGWSYIEAELQKSLPQAQAPAPVPGAGKGPAPKGPGAGKGPAPKGPGAGKGPAPKGPGAVPVPQPLGEQAPAPVVVTPSPELKLYRQGAFAACWFLVIFVYWLAIRGVRRSAREFIEAATDRT